MDRKRLTPENAARAETYLPLALKSALAKVLLPGCIEKIDSQPPRWQKNIVGCTLAETYVLAGYYLHLIDTSGLEEPEPKFDFTLEQYDGLSRLEDDLIEEWEIKGREIMADFNRFLDILNQEIENRLAEKNNLLNRLGEVLAVGVTPEAVKELRQALEQAKGGEAG